MSVPQPLILVIIIIISIIISIIIIIIIIIIATDWVQYTLDILTRVAWPWRPGHTQNPTSHVLLQCSKNVEVKFPLKSKRESEKKRYESSAIDI